MNQPKKLENELLDIIQGCRKNNRSAQNQLYRKYYSYGMSICYRYVNNKEDAQSILNNGYLKIFKNIKRYDSQYDFKPWFKTIMVNTAINHVKKMKKFKAEIGMEELKIYPTTEEILSKINFEELLHTIQSLSVAYRTVFNMYVLDGYKHEEIAKELGISVSTSKSNLSRAKVKLRELIQRKLTIHG